MCAYYKNDVDPSMQLAGWRTCWFIFAGYALVVLLLFLLAFRANGKTQ